MATAERTRINLYLPKRLAERIQSEASEMGLSANAYVISMLSHYYNGLDASRNSAALKHILEEWKQGFMNMDQDRLNAAKEEFDQLNFFVE